MFSVQTHNVVVVSLQFTIHRSTICEEDTGKLPPKTSNLLEKAAFISAKLCIEHATISGLDILLKFSIYFYI